MDRENFVRPVIPMEKPLACFGYALWGTGLLLRLPLPVPCSTIRSCHHRPSLLLTIRWLPQQQLQQQLSLCISICSGLTISSPCSVEMPSHRICKPLAVEFLKFEIGRLKIASKFSGHTDSRIPLFGIHHDKLDPGVGHAFCGI